MAYCCAMRKSYKRQVFPYPFGLNYKVFGQLGSGQRQGNLGKRVEICIHYPTVAIVAMVIGDNGLGYQDMSNKKKTPAKKKSTGAKKPSAKKSLPKVDKIEINVPTPDEVKDVIADTWKSIQADDFRITPATKKGLLARLKSWFKVS